jgi:putative membrane protein
VGSRAGTRAAWTGVDEQVQTRHASCRVAPVRLVVWWASNFVALLAAAWIVEGISYDSVWWLIFAALVFGLVNLSVRPLLVLVALPAVILTLGIALFLIDAFMLWLAGKISPDFTVADFFWAAILGAIVIWAVNMVLQAIFRDDKSAGA